MESGGWRVESGAVVRIYIEIKKQWIFENEVGIAITPLFTLNTPL